MSKMGFIKNRTFLAYWLLFDLFVIGCTLFKIVVRYSGLITPIASRVCDWNSSTIPTSTERNVVLLYGTSLGRGLTACYKSLRSTGAKCRIILFLPKKLTIPSNAQEEFDFYNIEIIRFTPHKKKDVKVPHMDRYYHEHDWLEKNIDSVDKVLHTDAYDVFFQGDPFSEIIDNETISFAVEPHQFKSCGWNQAWLRECYGNTAVSKLFHNFIICSGSIGGPSKEYLKLLKLMINTQEWTNCWAHSMDQPILNYLLWTGEVDAANISYKLTGCNDGLFTMQWCVKEGNVLYNSHGQVRSLDNAVPSFLHQYNRFPSLQSKLFSSCGIH